MNNYQLPIDGNWTTADIIAVSTLVDDVLIAHEAGVDCQKILADYQAFCQVIPAKSEQKAFDRDLAQQTGYSIYQTIKQAQQTTRKQLHL
ncbi:UPF0223 family protein [Convivina intestini]|uniref:Uncharacterized protein YktA (UPF0223 family) n=1 Tax=Convivina intestini TaxID=1505726 RepID=A0A2U1DFV1_9LACO|nr:UPF0223 family protein [Convivina intestini]PVY86432.1 uncharacterized protein YktA (UPF0223 family) [Convivina intestini]CAH1850327.1 hypothetical protein R077811_00065 [Convivina intestini]SDB83635.1 Uncharacterized protein YktA, UPF0223 family [Leuconostocaceae bacterium R-53105]